MNLGGSELAILLAIALVIFGGERIPKLARSLGEAQREFLRGQTETPVLEHDDGIGDV